MLPYKTPADVTWELRRMLQFLKSYYEQHMWPKWTTAYKNYFLYKIDRAIRLNNDTQTNIKLGVVKMYVDAMRTAVYDTLLNFRVMGRNKDDHKKSQAAKNFLEWGFAVSKSRPELMSTLKEALITGVSYGKEGFVNKQYTKQYKKGLKTEEYTYTDQYPYLNYVSVFDIFHDPQVESFEKSQYCFHRKIRHESEVYKIYSSFMSESQIKTVIETSVASPWYFSNFDFNKVKLSAFWNQDQIMMDYVAQGQTTTHAMINSREFDIYIKNYLTVDYKQKYHEVIEYWEDDRLCVMINGHLLYDGCNPLPVKAKPFYSLVYNKIPGIPFGHGIGTSLEDIQSITDEVINLTLDNIKFHVAPMYQKIKGSEIFQTGSGLLEYEPFKIIETNTPNAIQRIDLGTNDFAGINLVQFMLQFAEMSEGINSYAIGYQNKVERSATGVSALVQAFKSRLLPLTETLNAALSHIAEMWLATAVMLMDEKTSLRIQDEDGKVEFKDLNIQDLLGKFDIEFDMQALKSATREVRRQQLTQLLPMAVQAGIDGATGTPIIDMRKLWKEVIDSFELPADVILETSDVLKKQAAMEMYKQKMGYQVGQNGQQYQPGGGGAAPEPAVGGGFAAMQANPGQIPQNIPQSVPLEGIAEELATSEREDKNSGSNILQKAYNFNG